MKNYTKKLLLAFILVALMVFYLPLSNASVIDSVTGYDSDVTMTWNSPAHGSFLSSGGTVRFRGTNVFKYCQAFGYTGSTCTNNAVHTGCEINHAFVPGSSLTIEANPGHGGIPGTLTNSNGVYTCTYDHTVPVPSGLSSGSYIASTYITWIRDTNTGINIGSWGEHVTISGSSSTGTPTTFSMLPIVKECSGNQQGYRIQWYNTGKADSYTVRYATGGSSPSSSSPIACTSTAHDGELVEKCNHKLTSMTMGTTYRYRVYATNTYGTTTSSNTQTITAESCTLPPPSTPTLSSGNVCSSFTPRITLSWNSISGATSYAISRCTGSSCTPTGTTYSTSSTSYTDTVVTTGTVYRYRVRAYRSSDGQYSSYSNTVQQTAPNCCSGSMGNACSSTCSGATIQCDSSCSPDNCVPQSFNSVSAAAACNGASADIGVNWAAAFGASSYQVRACSGSGCNPLSGSVVCNTASTSCTHGNVTNNQTYRYSVRAVNANGNVDSTNTASVVAPTVITRACKEYTQEAFESIHNTNVTHISDPNVQNQIQGNKYYACPLDSSDNLCCLDESSCIFNGVCYPHLYSGDLDNDGINEKCIAQSPGEWIDDLEVFCDNGVDDDLDGLLDCVDPDCDGVLSGTITDESGNGILGARVNVFDSSFTQVGDAVTAADGSYSAAVSCGTHSMIVNADQYQARSQQPVQVPGRGLATQDLVLVLGNTCEGDCTQASGDTIFATCEGYAGCSFYDAQARTVCDYAQPGWVRDYSATQEVVCPDGAPRLKINVNADVTCPSENLIKSTRLVNYRGELVKMVVVMCG